MTKQRVLFVIRASSLIRISGFVILACRENYVPPAHIFIPAKPARSPQAESGARAGPAALALLGVEYLTVIGADLEMNLIFNLTGADMLNDVSAADPAKWTARIRAFRYVGAVLSNVLPDTLYVSLTSRGAEAGADVLGYANVPSDIADSLGRFLAAFAGFPL